MTASYNLKAIPPLYPILQDEEGVLIDGNHRLNVDVNWPKMTVKGIKGHKLRLLAQIVANTQRRYVTRRERREQFTELAAILHSENVDAGRMTGEIAKLTGFDQRYIATLLPEAYKAKVGIGPRPSKFYWHMRLGGGWVDIQQKAHTLLTSKSKELGVAKSSVMSTLILYWIAHPEIIDLTKLKHYGYKNARPKRYATGEIVK